MRDEAILALWLQLSAQNAKTVTGITPRHRPLIRRQLVPKRPPEKTRNLHAVFISGLPKLPCRLHSPFFAPFVAGTMSLVIKRLGFQP
jgi:hypothetical protein